jgi:uncharacterized protein (TIGR01777 family)
VLRLGVVLGRGGALAAMRGPFGLGLGGVLGSGAQSVSWIAIDDLVAMVLWALDNEAASGPFNAVAPAPCTNASLSAAVGRALHRPTIARVPAFALRALLGEGADVALGGQRVAPTRAVAAGFSASITSLDDAVARAFA